MAATLHNTFRLFLIVAVPEDTGTVHIWLPPSPLAVPPLKQIYSRRIALF